MNHSVERVAETLDEFFQVGGCVNFLGAELRDKNFPDGESMQYGLVGEMSGV